jgi:sarcosine oxidase subunit gamma
MADLAAAHALAHVRPIAGRDGLALREDPSVRIVLLLERRDDPGFQQRVAKAFGVAPPTKANTVAKGSASLAWIAPGQWFALGTHVDARDGVDVSDAYCALRLSGPRAAELLSKSLPVDLSVGAFPARTCVRTMMGSIPIFLMREADGFLILVERSLAHAAWTWLADGANALSR